MKKKMILALAMLVLIGLTFAACAEGAPSEPPPLILMPMIMVEDSIYRLTPEMISFQPDDETVFGTITSAVDARELPSENGQSNFQPVGAEYIYYEDGLLVYWGDGRWAFFAKCSD